MKDCASPSPPNTGEFRKLKLPTIQIDAFDGKSSAKYVTFINLFDSLVHNDKGLDSVQKLHYLRSFLKDEALDIIKELPLDNSSYLEARKLLKDRYYNKQKIVKEHVSSLLDLPALVKGGSIRAFISQIKQSLAALKNLEIDVGKWDPILIVIFTRKLDAYTAKAFQLERDIDKEPTVSELLEFLEKRALASENSDAPASTSNWKSSGKLAVNVAVQGAPCAHCKSSSHKIYTCKSFQLLPSAERIKVVTDNNLCNICLNQHKGKCRFHFRCSHCKKNHNSLVHPEEANTPVTLFSNVNNNVLLPTARVKLFSKDNKEVHVKAILDSGSQASLVTSKVIEVLKLTPTRSKTNIVGVTNSINNIKYSIPLEVCSLVSDYKTTVNFHVVDNITCKLPQQPIDISKLNLPPGLDLADSTFNTPSEINMLMGADIFFQVLLPQSEQESSSLASNEQRRQRRRQQQHEETQSSYVVTNTRFGTIVAGALPADTYSNNNNAKGNYYGTCEGFLPVHQRSKRPTLSG
ncbi:hypothetical protein ABMA27_007121 [Loxostege sticticalis]|uniref:Peptidase aspartic putative domain-containing protein n=1 Tax=Loxostege sticticalis TaxID=481309 RepID=A0ABR3ILN5_LOXSC